MGQITIFARMGVKPQNVEALQALVVEASEGAADEPGTPSPPNRSARADV